MESTIARMMVRARIAMTIRDVFAWDCFFAISLQLSLDLLRQLQADALDARDFFRPGSQDSFN